MFAKQIENGLNLADISKNIEAIYDSSLLPGENIPLHFHPDFEEIYYVLSGYGIITIWDEKQEISRSDVAYIPPLAPHTLLNTGNVPLRFVTISVKVSSPTLKNDVQPYIR